jgi:hypothetical protein
MKNRLYCTFLTQYEVDEFLDEIFQKYPILFGKAFVLNTPIEDEVLVTFNIDYHNYNVNALYIPNTILVHRKKQTNTLYTINALNAVIKHLNGGMLDNSFQIPWGRYRNSLLLTKEGGFKITKTKLRKVVER